MLLSHACVLLVRHHVIFFIYIYSFSRYYYLKWLTFNTRHKPISCWEPEPLSHCSCSLYALFWLYSVEALSNKNSHTLVFRPELDACDSPDKYPQLFQVLLEIEVENTEKQKDLTPPWEQFPTKDLSPNVLFSCHQEHKDALAVAGNIQ